MCVQEAKPFPKVVFDQVFSSLPLVQEIWVVHIQAKTFSSLLSSCSRDLDVRSRSKTFPFLCSRYYFGYGFKQNLPYLETFMQIRSEGVG
jgi:hypothetical protein